jgi:hypothetical protein
VEILETLGESADQLCSRTYTVIVEILDSIGCNKKSPTFVEDSSVREIQDLLLGSVLVRFVCVVPSPAQVRDFFIVVFVDAVGAVIAVDDDSAVFIVHQLIFSELIVNLAVRPRNSNHIS